MADNLLVADALERENGLRVQTIALQSTGGCLGAWFRLRLPRLFYFAAKERGGRVWREVDPAVIRTDPALPDLKSQLGYHNPLLLPFTKHWHPRAWVLPALFGRDR